MSEIWTAVDREDNRIAFMVVDESTREMRLEVKSGEDVLSMLRDGGYPIFMGIVGERWLQREIPWSFRKVGAHIYLDGVSIGDDNYHPHRQIMRLSDSPIIPKSPKLFYASTIRRELKKRGYEPTHISIAVTGGGRVDLSGYKIILCGLCEKNKEQFKWELEWKFKEDFISSPFVRDQWELSQVLVQEIEDF